MSGRGRGRGGNPGPGGGLLLGGNGPGPTNRPPQKLVLPGNPNAPPSSGAKLIIPDKGMEKILQEGAAALGPEVVTLTGPSRYRPPAGFMNEDGIQEFPELETMTPDQMISRLRSRAGKWYKLAKMLPYLARAGYDSTVVDEMTGITPAEQSKWAVASTVWDSLEASPIVSSEILATFDQRGDDVLYPIRNLQQEVRVHAALYAAGQKYDGVASEILARAMKEWERRPTERQGFTEHPGDCMAFKYMRDALECKDLEEAELRMTQAFRVVITDGGRARLHETLAELRGTNTPASGLVAGSTGLGRGNEVSLTANLVILRLEPEDLGYRPIPVMGALGEASSLDLETAPRTTQSGAFGVFAIESKAAECSWVALPQWKALAMTRHPVALSIADCSTIPAILAGTRAKTEEDRRRLAGAGMMVAERGLVPSSNVDDDKYYLVPASSAGDSKLQLLDGAKVRARSLTAMATVVFVARPPSRDMGPASGNNDSFLQL